MINQLRALKYEVYHSNHLVLCDYRLPYAGCLGACTVAKTPGSTTATVDPLSRERVFSRAAANILKVGPFVKLIILEWS